MADKKIIFAMKNFEWIIDFATFAFFGILIPGFFTFNNFVYLLSISSMIGILVLGQSICLLAGNFDMSLAQTAGLSVLITGLLFTRWMPNCFPAALAIPFTIIIGALLGAVNGFFVGKLRMNSFLITLSTYLVYMFMKYYLLLVPLRRFELPYTFMILGSKVGVLYIDILVFLVLAVFLYFFLTRTSFGFWVYASGGDYETAKVLGIPTRNVIFATYAIAGAIAGIAGLVYAGFSGAITNSLCNGEVFWSFAGAIIGGISLRGGRGSIVGAVGGSIFIGIIDVGTTLLEVPPTLRNVVKGLLVLVAILVDRWREKTLIKLLTPQK
ncbi:MAG: ABC transporter permease [Candidatus Heimdallarchaeaceae archaeon]